MSSSASPLKLAIIGGGPGGLTLAAVMGKYAPHIAIDLYESKNEISIAGNSISIWKRPWQVLKDIGFEADLEKRGIPFPKDGESRGPLFRKSDQPEPGFDFYDHRLPYGPIPLRRPDLISIIQSHMSPNCTVHCSKKFESYEIQPSGEVLLKFADGTTATADILVGADGLHSKTRLSMFAPEPPKPKFSGFLAYRCLVDVDALNAVDPKLHYLHRHPKIWCGKGKHIASQPVGKTVFLTFFVNVPPSERESFNDPWIKDSSVAELKEKFANWEPDVQTIMSCMTEPSRWAIHTVDLPYSASGPVALLGDAAHAMTPYQGVGGGQAFEDAHILARLLGHDKTNRSNIADMLRIYDQVRLPRSKKAAERSYANGEMYEFIYSECDFDHEPSREELENVGRVINESFQWLATSSVEDDWKEAQEALAVLA